MVALATRFAGQIGCAHDSSAIIHPGDKPRIAPESADVCDDSAVPEEGVINKAACRRIDVACESGRTGDLSVVV